MTELQIKTEGDVARGAAFLKEKEPRFAQALTLTGPLPLRLRRDGFFSLLNIIVSQQISTASAAAIEQRLKTAGAHRRETLRAMPEEDLQACGLSRPKIRYALALARSSLDFDSLRDKPAKQVLTELTAIKGIGPWTAEIYLMFCLNRADVFAPGDLALQEAYRILFKEEERPKEKDFRRKARDWIPWRSVAARLLWSYYRVKKQREGIR